MLVTTCGEINKKSVTERCPRLPGKRVCIKIAELFHVYQQNLRIRVEKYNHFENAVSATDKENDMRHISHWVRARIVIVNNPWLELLAGSSRQ